MKIALIILIVLAALVLIGWLGLQIQPAPFPAYAGAPGDIKSVPLPAGLPAPVERYYRVIYGDQVPVLDTVVITGRGTMKPAFNIALPVRFLIVHNAGRDYRHYFEATWFGIPILKVDEGYIDGKSFFESPMGTYYDDPNSNQGANLAVWAEAAWFPALWVTDPRARWQEVDEHTALLFVPFEDGEENFVVRFNPETGIMDLMEAMRFRGNTDSQKVLWLTYGAPDAASGGDSFAMWLDAGKPWLKFNIESMVFNADVSEFIRGRGYDR